jgi:hypothetical protein
MSSVVIVMETVAWVRESLTQATRSTVRSWIDWSLVVCYETAQTW